MLLNPLGVRPGCIPQCGEESRPGYAEIVLRGSWTVDGTYADVETQNKEGNTYLVVNNIRHAIPVQIKLKRNN